MTSYKKSFIYSTVKLLLQALPHKDLFSWIINNFYYWSIPFIWINIHLFYSYFIFILFNLPFCTSLFYFHAGFSLFCFYLCLFLPFYFCWFCNWLALFPLQILLTVPTNYIQVVSFSSDIAIHGSQLQMSNKMI